MKNKIVAVVVFFQFVFAACERNESAFSFSKAAAIEEQLRQYPKVEYLNLNFEDGVWVNQNQYNFSEQSLQLLEHEYGLPKDKLLTFKKSFKALGIQSMALNLQHCVFITDSFKGDVVGYLKTKNSVDSKPIQWQNVTIGHYRIRDADPLQPGWWSVSGMN